MINGLCTAKNVKLKLLPLKLMWLNKFTLGIISDDGSRWTLPFFKKAYPFEFNFFRSLQRKYFLSQESILPNFFLRETDIFSGFATKLSHFTEIVIFFHYKHSSLTIKIRKTKKSNIGRIDSLTFDT